jgi:chorismate dehydratase
LAKIRVGIVNYLNTKPLLYGLQHSPVASKIELLADYPSHLADMLTRNEIDLGLVPIASIPDLEEYHVIGNHCIGTEGEIASVALFSDLPLQKIEKVYLDYQSRTSAALLQYLLTEAWGIHPEIIHADNEEYRKLIKGTTAGLVIGDRAFEQRRISNYIYDLGSEWKAITGLPFVFAAWVSNKPLPASFIQEFDEANARGLDHIDEIVTTQNFTLFDLNKYYRLHLSYRMNDQKRKSMSLFLQYISQYSFLQ